MDGHGYGWIEMDNDAKDLRSLHGEKMGTTI